MRGAEAGTASFKAICAVSTWAVKSAQPKTPSVRCVCLTPQTQESAEGPALPSVTLPLSSCAQRRNQKQGLGYKCWGQLQHSCGGWYHFAHVTVNSAQLSALTAEEFMLLTMHLCSWGIQSNFHTDAQDINFLWEIFFTGRDCISQTDVGISPPLSFPKFPPGR